MSIARICGRDTSLRTATMANAKPAQPGSRVQIAAPEPGPPLLASHSRHLGGQVGDHNRRSFGPDDAHWQLRFGTGKKSVQNAFSPATIRDNACLGASVWPDACSGARIIGDTCVAESVLCSRRKNCDRLTILCSNLRPSIVYRVSVRRESVAGQSSQSEEVQA